MTECDANHSCDKSAERFSGTGQHDGAVCYQASGEKLGRESADHACGSGGQSDEWTFLEFHRHPDPDSGAGDGRCHLPTRKSRSPNVPPISDPICWIMVPMISVAKRPKAIPLNPSINI